MKNGEMRAACNTYGTKESFGKQNQRNCVTRQWNTCLVCTDLSLSVLVSSLEEYNQFYGAYSDPLLLGKSTVHYAMSQQ